MARRKRLTSKDEGRGGGDAKRNICEEAHYRVQIEADSRWNKEGKRQLQRHPREKVGWRGGGGKGTHQRNTSETRGG